jgi:hypothetical protein
MIYTWANLYRYFISTALVTGAASLGGCASIAPNFDIPTDPRGVPSTASIVQRIRCELIPQPYEHRTALLAYDYEVAMLLSINVTDKGAIEPSLNFPFKDFSFNVGGNLSQSRGDSLSINLSYSMRDLAHDWVKGYASAQCPSLETNLAGDLGLRRSVSAALETPDLKPGGDVSPTAGEFSGSIEFTVARGVSNLGPTWTLVHFKGPGELASLSRESLNKLSFGFATGKGAGQPFRLRERPQPSVERGRRANDALARQLTNDLGTQLTVIRNLLR